MSSILDVGNILPSNGRVSSRPIGIHNVGRCKILDNEDYESVRKMMEFEDQFPETKGMDRKQRHDFFKAKVAEMRAGLDEKKRKHGDLGKELALLTKEKNDWDEIYNWTNSALILEKPASPSFRRLRKDISEGKVFSFGGKLMPDISPKEYEKEVFRFAEIMMIEHDWASAFKSADVKDAVVKLPYDVCAFEFRFSGRVVIALATQFETDILFALAMEVGGRWMMFDAALSITHGREGSDKVDGIVKLVNIIADQIRFACIALDAEVATSEVVREPHASSHGKNNYQPLKSYHVVRLANRGPRALPLASNGDSGRHVRLHFRRGHWRHFEAHKTWIKWMLVGDPDLGFVDKHYKL